jgi:hypothetical protein
LYYNIFEVFPTIENIIYVKDEFVKETPLNSKNNITLWKDNIDFCMRLINKLSSISTFKYSFFVDNTYTRIFFIKNNNIILFTENYGEIKITSILESDFSSKKRSYK